MGASSVVERTMAMLVSVPVDACGLAHGHAHGAVMAGVTEMIANAKDVACGAPV